MIDEEDSAARLERCEAFLHEGERVGDMIECLEARDRIEATTVEEVEGEHSAKNSSLDIGIHGLCPRVCTRLDAEDVLETELLGSSEHESVAAADIEE